MVNVTRQASLVCLCILLLSSASLPAVATSFEREEAAEGRSLRQFMLNAASFTISNARFEPKRFDPSAGETTTLNFDLSGDAKVVKIKIVDNVRNLIKIAKLKKLSAGQNSWTWNGKDDTDKIVAAGSYKAKIVARSYSGEKAKAKAAVKVKPSGWSEDVRLTYARRMSWIPRVATSGSNVYVVWGDAREGNHEIYFKKSTDSGTTWGDDVRLTNAKRDSDNPMIAVSGPNVHVVWHDSRDGNYEIYYKRSTDSGATWDPDVRLTNAPSDGYTPRIAADGSNVYVAWGDRRDGNYEIYYKKSTDYGTTWGDDVRLTNDPNLSYDANVGVDGSNIHIVWTDNRDGNYEIYYKKSTDYGTTWGDDVRLTNDPGDSSPPIMVISGPNIYVVWFDDRDGNNEVYFKGSVDSGATWGPDIRLTRASGSSLYPRAAADGSNVYVVWQDERDGNYEIYYKKGTDSGASWSSDVRLTNYEKDSQVPAIAIAGSNIHVVWYDHRDGNDEIYYKAYRGI